MVKVYALVGIVVVSRVGDNDFTQNLSEIYTSLNWQSSLEIQHISLIFLTDGGMKARLSYHLLQQLLRTSTC